MEKKVKHLNRIVRDIVSQTNEGGHPVRHIMVSHGNSHDTFDEFDGFLSKMLELSLYYRITDVHMNVFPEFAFVYIEVGESDNHDTDIDADFFELFMKIKWDRA
jgi:hypothetical protein